MIRSRRAESYLFRNDGFILSKFRRTCEKIPFTPPRIHIVKRSRTTENRVSSGNIRFRTFRSEKYASSIHTDATNDWLATDIQSPRVAREERREAVQHRIARHHVAELGRSMTAKSIVMPVIAHVLPGRFDRVRPCTRGAASRNSTCERIGSVSPGLCPDPGLLLVPMISVAFKPDGTCQKGRD